MANPSFPADPAPEHDLMNDPMLDASWKMKQKSVDDADTCRICRGEGSKEEPLFYPCKCSGSIKFVHQNCLMEWLSHSQKKHCELCKTSFRFTKLYHPHMPNSVPLPVFLRQAAVHTLRTCRTWSRFHLVLFVWAGWLPWCMRTVFRGLFWLGDGAWISWQKAEEQAIAQQFERLATDGTTPANTQFLLGKESSATAMFNHMAKSLPQFFSPASPTLNLSASRPTIFNFARRLFMGFLNQTIDESIPSSPAVTGDITHTTGIGRSSPSWLSNFKFFKSLTRSPTLNNLVTDTIEGQIITLLVVIAFILVFLIREWVVQQQPGMNIAAAPVAEAVAVAQAREAPPPEHAARQHAEQFLLRGHGGEIDVAVENEELPRELIRRPRMAVMPRPRRQVLNPTNREQENRDDPSSHASRPESENQLFDSSQADLSKTEDDDGNNSAKRPRRSSLPNSSTHTFQRPVMPSREFMARAAEIRRTLEEQQRASGQREWPGVKVFKELWNRAGSNPAEVIRIVEEEGRGEELGWIIAAMNRLENIPSVHDDLSRVTEFGSLGEISNRNSNNDGASDNPQSPTAVDHHIYTGFEMPTSTDRLPSDSGTPSASSSSLDHFHPRLGLRPMLNPKMEDGDQVNAGIFTMDTTSKGDANTIFNARPESSNNNPFHPDYSDDDTQELEVTSAATDAPELVAALPNREEAADEPGEEQELSLNETQLPDQVEAPVVNHGLVDAIINWLWGGINPPMDQPADRRDQEAGDDEHIVDNLADEAPFVPVEHGQPVMEDIGNERNAAQDPEVVAAAVQAGIDPNGVEAVDDGEDLEGIMELVGMQGPLAGLIQNGMFCAVLVSMTIFLGMWVPYIAGKLFLVFLANPFSLLVKMPLRWASVSADLIIDFIVIATGCAFYWLDTILRFMCQPIGWIIPSLAKLNQNRLLPETAKSYAEGALMRLAKTFEATGSSLSESDIPTFSITAHESLRLIEHRFASLMMVIHDAIIAVLGFSPLNAFNFGKGYESLSTNLIKLVEELSNLIAEKGGEFIDFAPSVLKINPLRVSLNIPQRIKPLDYNLVYWDTKDRIFAIIFGYMFFSVIGVLYLRINASLRGRNRSGKVDGAFADVLYQAGGVLKVILIISIEMIAFPLYCGLLLDVALLPLFGNVTVKSRLNFLIASPNTSLFVHWFVGTCYMFHFALFVSMCRKIMRNGVLCRSIESKLSNTFTNSIPPDFIRDPDDPTFHPVRDVLERSVSTQLRKIAFSALVYGALVILCLGGVVWGIYLAFDNIFPIHWSSNEPVLEFPVDLLFYNFLMPLAVKFFNPSVGLNKMYSWWFRKCARALRLSHFLFGTRKEDEEGRHVRRTWSGWLLRKQGDIDKPVIGTPHRVIAEDNETQAFFLRDGRYVLTPASDQVRIPKGVNTFVDVNEEGMRVDGLADSNPNLHGSNNDLFAKVYIPPFFRVRISLLILLIWLFAATTGVCITIIPLVFGRLVFTKLIPNHRRMNDIYAFSIGLYIIGGSLYTLVHYRKFLAALRTSLAPGPDSSTAAFLRQLTAYSVRLLRLLYTYLAFAFLLPSLLSLIIEFYVVIPLHTYFGSPLDRHIIHFIQDWTLGVLYIKMAGRLILWYAPSRPADALRGIVRHGWLNPDVRLATRSFIFPASLLMGVAFAAPLSLAWTANRIFFSTADAVFQTRVYRYSYPAVLAFGVLLALSYLVGVAFRGWRRRIRDEVYLIGERLHNFGERRVIGPRVTGKRVASRV
ncbi:hypothetical protein MMC31_001079 [Peltigera leucophlebia]|nr:hypothetical protein [Peltigera leucophlebia]